MVFPAFLGRNSIGGSFCTGGILLVEIHVDGLLGSGGEGDAKVVSGVDVV